jgi:hypothetical protein
MAYLRAKETQTWGEICQILGKRNAESHFIPIARIAKEAQSRIRELHYDKHRLMQDGEIFSLHVTGRARLWGVVDTDKGIFFVVWYDREHEIYPVEKFHT